jgi:hypothetical protein
MNAGDYVAPGILIVAGEERAAIARAAIATIGARSQSSVGTAALADLAGYDLLLAWLEDGEALEALFAHLGNRQGCVLAIPFALVDRAWTLVEDRPIWLVCDPDEAVLADRLAEALAALAPANMVRETRGRPAELRRLSGEVARIARALETLSAAEPAASAIADAPLPSAAAIRAVLRARRLRDRFFEPALFADPAWDMLLDLMAARIEARNVAVSSLCIAAAVPVTTALRWIRAMTDSGLFHRVADSKDGRRAFVALSDDAAQAVAAYFAELAILDLPGA